MLTPKVSTLPKQAIEQQYNCEMLLSNQYLRWDAIMSRHINLLRPRVQDPVSANIHWREVESLLHHLGATLEPTHGARCFYFTRIDIILFNF